MRLIFTILSKLAEAYDFYWKPLIFFYIPIFIFSLQTNSKKSKIQTQRKTKRTQTQPNVDSSLKQRLKDLDKLTRTYSSRQR